MLTKRYINRGRLGIAFASLLIIIGVSIAKSSSIWSYTAPSIDERMVVQFAVGFLGLDFNPHWFGYHTLPMYILSIVYWIEYVLVVFMGNANSLLDFASQVLINDAQFYISGRLVCSFVYTLGTFVLAYILWSQFNSKIAAIVFFVISNILHDAFRASNYIRVDTFVFLFTTLTIYFSCFSEKTTRNCVLSMIFAAAAFCSKFTAISVVAVLFIQIIYDVYYRKYPKKCIYSFICLIPMLVVIFMPYAAIDFDTYKYVLGSLFRRGTGQFLHVGKAHVFTLDARIFRIYSILREQVGIIYLLGAMSFLMIALHKHRYGFVLMYIISYSAVFLSSITIDYYWYRPVFPYILFFAFVTIVIVADDASRMIHDKGFLLKVKLHELLAAILVIGCAMQYYYVHQALIKDIYMSAWVKSVDNRIIAKEWINKHIAQESRIWLDTECVMEYHPKILAINKEIDRELRFGGYKHEKNRFMSDIYELVYEKLQKTERKYDVRIINHNRIADRYCDMDIVQSGDYIILSSYVYNRFLDSSRMNGMSELARSSQEYYGFLWKQNLLATFSGPGPVISIYSVRDYPKAR